MRNGAHSKGLRWLAVCALWLGVWQAASLFVGSPILLASPAQTLVHLVRIVANPGFWPIVWFSLSYVAAGFLGAFVLAVGLAFLAHRYPLVRELLEPPVLAFKSVPVACIVVLLLIWVGSRRVSGLAVFLVAFPALYLSTLEGLAQVDPKVDEMLGVFGVRPLVRLLAHTWPQVLPYVVATSKNVCGMAWKAGVAAELIGTPAGSMGERIYQSKILLETADLFAWTVAVVAVSYACEKLFVLLLAKTGPASLRAAVALGRRRAPSALSAGAITCDNVALGYANEPIVSALGLSLAAGERGILSDASGAGKTTLLHTLAGLVPALGGRLVVPQELSMVFQETRLVDALTAEENVLLVGTNLASREEARALLAEVLPADALGKPVSELSGGQRRRVELVRALAHPSAAVLLDEPFSSLDEASHAQAAAFVLARLAGRTLLVASHQAEDAALLDARPLSLTA